MKTVSHSHSRSRSVSSSSRIIADTSEQTLTIAFAITVAVVTVWQYLLTCIALLLLPYRVLCAVFITLRAEHHYGRTKASVAVPVPKPRSAEIGAHNKTHHSHLPIWRHRPFLPVVMAVWLLLFSICFSQTASALAVFDSANYHENMLHRVLDIEQWARSNINQLDQIARLNTGNVTLDETQLLMEKNYAMDYKSTWQEINAMQEQSLALLYASKAAWDEFGSSQRYYASFLKAQAWTDCLQGNSRCTFATTLNKLEDSTIAQAMQAYQNAEHMNSKLEEQITKLRALNHESEQSQSEAGTIDALAKINGAVASSMVDLNTQVSQLTKLQSHAMAKESSRELATDAYFHEITSFEPVNEKPLPVTLPDID